MSFGALTQRTEHTIHHRHRSIDRNWPCRDTIMKRVLQRRWDSPSPLNVPHVGYSGNPTSCFCCVHWFVGKRRSFLQVHTFSFYPTPIMFGLGLALVLCDQTKNLQIFPHVRELFVSTLIPSNIDRDLFADRTILFRTLYAADISFRMRQYSIRIIPYPRLGTRRIR